MKHPPRRNKNCPVSGFLYEKIMESFRMPREIIKSSPIDMILCSLNNHNQYISINIIISFTKCYVFKFINKCLPKVKDLKNN